MADPKKKQARFGVEIHRCTCKNEYQDKRYGKGRRVCNLCEKGARARCTVCGKVH